jgi:xanthosine utilization system XapX-like protein
MHYTRIALLTFGAGLVLGLVVVVIEIDWLDRPASGLMALGLAAIPIGMIVDWRLATKSARRPAKRRSRTQARPKAAPPRRNPRVRSAPSKPKR